MNKSFSEKAVLIYPRFDNYTFWSFRKTLQLYTPRTKYGTIKAAFPPLGLMGLFNHLKVYYKKIVLIDMNVNPININNVIDENCHVYVSGMIAQKNNLLKVLRIAKNRGAKVIVGGTIVDSKGEIFDEADHLIENEAEMVIDNLLLGLMQRNAKKYYKGLHTIPEKFFIPDYSSIDINNYTSMAIQTSRGCPEACEFCDITARFGRNVRLAPWSHIENCFLQLAVLKSTLPVFIVDDNFIGNPGKTIELLKKMHDLEKRITYRFSKYTEVSMRLGHDTEKMKELRYWLRKNNFTSLFIGVETPNEDALRETGKLQNIKEDMSKTLNRISEETGASVMMGMIYGFDSDHPESMNKFVRFINSSRSPLVMLGLLTALPYTRLEERLKKEGRLFKQSTGNNSDGSINFVPKNMTAEKAEEVYLKILEKIYSAKAYFRRVLRETETLIPKYTTKKVEWNYAITGIKLFLGRNAHTFMRYLPKASRIARKRYGLFSKAYFHLMKEYLTNCAKYVHFKDQIKVLRRHRIQKGIRCNVI